MGSRFTAIALLPALWKSERYYSMYENKRLWSKSKKYVVDISKEYKDISGRTLYAAVVMESIRSYFQPVLQGIGLTQNEIDGYL